MSLDLPTELPAMTLAEAVLLPETVMPLYIFENRYRRMLADALASHRMFVILNEKKRADPAAKRAQAFHSIATVGVIRLSSLNADGTSTVMLQGAERVSVLEVTQELPYRKVRVAPAPDEGPPLSIADDAAKRAELLALIESVLPSDTAASRELLEACRHIASAVGLASFAMQALCSGAADRQRFLETTRRRERVELAIRGLRETRAELKLRHDLGEHMPDDSEPDS